jgi:hypothetical protein
VEKLFMDIIMMGICALAIIVNAVKTRELTPMKKTMDMIYPTKMK